MIEIPDLDDISSLTQLNQTQLPTQSLPNRSSPPSFDEQYDFDTDDAESAEQLQFLSHRLNTSVSLNDSDLANEPGLRSSILLQNAINLSGPHGTDTNHITNDNGIDEVNGFAGNIGNIPVDRRLISSDNFHSEDYNMNIHPMMVDHNMQLEQSRTRVVSQNSDDEQHSHINIHPVPQAIEYSTKRYHNGNMSTPQINTYGFNLQTPMSNFQTRSHVEPSPQLPPMSAGQSTNRLTLSNGTEFSSIRRDLATDSKTPAEYTLHIIFTQFVRYAERKLNLCLEYPIDQEPPIGELFNEGVDDQFDKIVASLGYVARRKPKPVIDSVMYWRKSKSEVASIAALELEKVLAEVHPASIAGSTNIAMTKNSNGPRQKRSLSLMRTRSFSKVGHRRNQSVNSLAGSLTHKLDTIEPQYEDPTEKQLAEKRILESRKTAINADRKSLASIFILCRVLIEIVKQTSPTVMGDDLTDKLEEIVYTQLKTTDPINTPQSLVRSANWNLFAELLGYMSENRFVSVSDRFIAELESIPAKISREQELKLQLLIHGMQYLKLTNYPPEAFEETADFMVSLSKFFAKCQNETLTFAYCKVIGDLILPLGPILTAESNHPTWVEAMEIIFQKGIRIWNQSMKKTSESSNQSISPNRGIPLSISSFGSNGWAQSLHLITAALSVSRKELFSETWFDVISDNSFKLKPKADVEDKFIYIICIARLLWTYIYRLPDTLNNTIKKLDSLFGLLLNSSNSSKKQQWLSPDMHLMNAMVQLIRIVGYHHLNYTLDNVIIKMVKMSFNGTNLEGLSPERMLIVIKSYLAILKDYELANKPEFPVIEVFEQATGDENAFTSTVPNFRSSKVKKDSITAKNEKVKLNEFLFLAKNSKNAVFHEEVCKSFASLLRLLDSQYGSHFWLSETNGTQNSNHLAPLRSRSSSGSLKSQSPFSSFNFNLDFVFQDTKDLQISLFATLIDAVPWTMVPFADANAIGILFKSVVEILTRNAAHSDQRVSNASVGALKTLASKKNSSSLITIFAKIAFQFTDKPLSHYNPGYVNSKEFKLLLKIYVQLLNCWLKQFNDISESQSKGTNTNPFAQDDEAMNKDVLNDMYQINYKAEELVDSVSNKMKPSVDLEWKAIITVIEEVEGNGLFFLCSLDCEIRYLGVSILKLVELFDQAIFSITNFNSNGCDKSVSDSNNSKTHSRSSSKFAADIGTRLIHILEDVDFFELIKPYRKKLSVPEKTRLTKLKNKKQILIKLAESDYGIDATIWFRLYPRLLDIFFEKCPMPVAMCRSIVCVRLVQMHESVIEYSENFKSYTSSLFSKTVSTPPEEMINQWRLYLIFACCSLTSTNDQKISLPTQATHGRKKSLQMFIQHQKITSAKSVFRMVLPLLRSQQPMIRDSVIMGLSSMNINIFKTFLENLPQSVTEWDVPAKHDTSPDVRLSVEVVHIISSITSRFKSHEYIYGDDWILANLVSLVKNVKTFLSSESVQGDYKFQTLRRFFCTFLESLILGLLEDSSLKKWLPFEARIGCFNYLKDWCGYGDSTDVEQDRYNLMYKSIAKVKDGASIAAKLEVERKQLRFAALSCMATICSWPIKQELEVAGNLVVMSFDIVGVMNWIRGLLYSEDERCHEFGRIALRNTLELNLESDNEIWQEVIRECYTSQHSLKATESYFTIFVDVFLKRSHPAEPPYDVICLASFLVGNDNYEVRFAAIKLMRYLEDKFFNTSDLDLYTEAVCSRTKVVYKRALFEIANHSAAKFAEGASIRISYMTKFFNLVEESSRRDILACLLPWMRTIELSYQDDASTTIMDGTNEKHNIEEDTDKQSKSKPDAQKQLCASSLMVLNNLFEITVRFSSRISNEVEALWVALGSNANNFDKILDFILTNCLERKNQIFVEYARQVMDYLAFSQLDPLYLIDKFINNLQPKSMIPPQPRKASDLVENKENFPYFADLGKIIPYNEKDASFSMGQLSLVFLVDLFTVQNDRMIEKLPTLLHISVSLLDHYLPIVQEQAAMLLIHMIHVLACKEPKAVETMDILRQKDHLRYLWVYDDLNNDKKGTRTPRNMDLLVRNILEIFVRTVPTLQEEWSRVSLHWATTCAVRHLACRSFQVFRSLLSFLDQSMLRDMMHRLSNTISDETLDIQGFAMQILMTMNAITAELDSEKLIDFPQLFWSGVACLSTIHEQEFIEVLSTMSKFVSKIDLDAPDTISCLISTFPPKWEGIFEGLQQVILVGLRSSTSWDPTVKFLDKLLTFNDSEVIGSGDSRLLIAVVANLPRFLHALDEKHITKEINEAADNLGMLADKCGKESLSRILYSLSKNRFRSKKDFLAQTILTINSLFFPEYAAQVLVFLLGLLSNKIPWVKLETINILKHVLSLVDLQRDEFVGVGADLISPLLRLLLTDYAEPALEVLDEATSISGSQVDKDILRMSLGNTSMKKEYEKTATLFGIPEESGWAIPMPVVTAASTRNNVHAVFLTCSVNAVVDANDVDDDMRNEEIEFHMEDYHAPIPDHGDTVSLNVEEQDASLSNVWAALDDFDSFFTKDTNPESKSDMGFLLGRRDQSTVHHHTDLTGNHGSEGYDQTGHMESVPYVYEKDVSFILNRSLARSQSNTSFKTSLADSMGHTNLGIQDSLFSTRRSYLPFRQNKAIRGKNEGSITPSLSLSPQFDAHSPTYRQTQATSNFSGNSQFNPSSESPQSSGSGEHPTRLESLLGTNRKKTKKVSTPSHVHTTTSNVQPNMYYQSPPSKQFTSPLGTTVVPGTFQTPKVRDKRRTTQKK
jgi:hypothetical protein